MRDAIGDTGPFLHLHEIRQLEALAVFESITVPILVEEELDRHGLVLQRLEIEGSMEIFVSEVEKSEWMAILEEENLTAIQPADAQVAALSRRAGESKIVATDDLALRRRIETSGAPVVGSVGILVRAHREGLFEKSALEEVVELLLNESTLHLSEGFRGYVRSLIADL